MFVSYGFNVLHKALIYYNILDSSDICINNDVVFDVVITGDQEQSRQH